MTWKYILSTGKNPIEEQNDTKTCSRPDARPLNTLVFLKDYVNEGLAAKTVTWTLLWWLSRLLSLKDIGHDSRAARVQLHSLAAKIICARTRTFTQGATPTKPKSQRLSKRGGYLENQSHRASLKEIIHIVVKSLQSPPLSALTKQPRFYSAFIMQMYPRNALRWVISAILLFPLPYNAAVFNMSELRGAIIRMCPRFSIHYLAQLQSQKPQVLMAISFTCFPCQLLTRCTDSLGPTVHAHAQSICLCLFGCFSKALVKPDVPIKPFFLPQWVTERWGYIILY